METKICKHCNIEKHINRFDIKRGKQLSLNSVAEFHSFYINLKNYRSMCSKCAAFKVRELDAKKYQNRKTTKKLKAKPGHKYCTGCKIEKPVLKFHRSKAAARKYALYPKCKKCHSIERSLHYSIPENKVGYKVRMAKRRALLINATPEWSLTDIHQNKIKTIYKNCPDGFDVDHIMPLNGKNVCGLHVHWNLEAIPAAENRAKRNYLPTPDKYRAK